MCVVEVTVELKGIKYKTNVIANKGMSDDAIKQLAKKQVLKQWNE
ncbi:BA3454 family stress response protein [Bacillus sp. EB01]|nr:BA3454 family stress response protein [Bacillus sp. EB01]